MSHTRYLIDPENLRQYILHGDTGAVTVLEQNGKKRRLQPGEKIHAIDDVISKRGNHKIIQIRYNILDIECTNTGLTIKRHERECYGRNNLVIYKDRPSVMLTVKETRTLQQAFAAKAIYPAVLRTDKTRGWTPHMRPEEIGHLFLFPQHLDRAWRARGENPPKELEPEKTGRPLPITAAQRDRFWTTGTKEVFSYDSVRTCIANTQNAEKKPKI